MTIRFVIPGKLAGKGRPRFVRATGRTFTPAKTRSAEAMIRTIAADAMRGRVLLHGAVALEIAIYLIPPKSWPRKKREAAHYRTGKPDADNSAKLVADSLNGIVWLDDAQISRLSVERYYTLDGPERAEITVRDLPAAPWSKNAEPAALRATPLFAGVHL